MCLVFLPAVIRLDLSKPVGCSSIGYLACMFSWNTVFKFSKRGAVSWGNRGIRRDQRYLRPEQVAKYVVTDVEKRIWGSCDSSFATEVGRWKWGPAKCWNCVGHVCWVRRGGEWMVVVVWIAVYVAHVRMLVKKIMNPWSNAVPRDHPKTMPKL